MSALRWGRDATLAQLISVLAGSPMMSLYASNTCLGQISCQTCDAAKSEVVDGVNLHAHRHNIRTNVGEPLCEVRAPSQSLHTVSQPTCKTLLRTWCSPSRLSMYVDHALESSSCACTHLKAKGMHRPNVMLLMLMLG